MRPDDRARPLSRRRSITVWLAGSVLGWGLVFAALDRVLAPDSQPVAEAEPPPAAVETASPAAEDILTPEELRRLFEIAPAAGGMPAEGRR